MEQSPALNNAKFLLILLVVFGHLIEPLIDRSVIIKTAYLSIYSFHIPAFVVIAGILSKAIFSKEQIKKNITALLVPLIAFTVLYEAFFLATNGEFSHYILGFKPYWLLWFLFSLFVWRMLLPILIGFPYPVLASVIISLIAGYVDSIGYFLGLSRTLYFLPFFIFGYKWAVGGISNPQLVRIPKIIYFAVLVSNVGLFWWLNDMSQQWLYGSLSYSNLGLNHLYGGIIRLGFYALSIITVISFLMLTSHRDIQILKTGERNVFYVYIWHGFIVLILVDFGLYNTISNFSDPAIMVILFVGATITTLFLATPFIARNTRRFILNPVNSVL